MARVPRVRVVVLNYDGGEMTLRCLRALRAVDWPQDSLEIMLVDNASIDGLAPRIRREMPWVRLIENTHNAGFAGGCNVGLRDLDGVDYVALLNNDTIPDRNWLRPLVDTLEADSELGAASSKMVFAPAFVTLTVESPTFRPSDQGSELGVKLTGLIVDGVEVWEHTQFADGCHAGQTRGSGVEQICWTDARAEIRVPIEPGAPLPEVVEVELAAERPKVARLSGGGTTVEAAVAEKPSWHRVPLAGRAYDVINNVGSRLVLGGYGGDRGFLEPDVGQYEQPEEVFAWCGGAVLLSVRYLRDVGIFNERYFMYYEDTDLAWRGRIAGWRYRYVPESVVRHVHAASSKEGSKLFVHFVERNRFLTLARNAPWWMLAEASYVYLRDTAVIFERDCLRRLIRRARPSPGLVKLRLRAYAGFLKLLPTTLVARWRQHASTADREEIVRRWAVPQ